MENTRRPPAFPRLESPFIPHPRRFVETETLGLQRIYGAENFFRCPLDCPASSSSLIYKMEFDYHLVAVHFLPMFGKRWGQASSLDLFLWFVSLFRQHAVGEILLEQWFNRMPYFPFPLPKNPRDFPMLCWQHVQRKRHIALSDAYYSNLLHAKPPPPTELRECSICQDEDPVLGGAGVLLCKNEHYVHDACAMGLFASWMVENEAMYRGQLRVEHRTSAFPTHNSAGSCPVCRFRAFIEPGAVFDLYVALWEKFRDTPDKFTGGPPPDVRGMISSHELLAQSLQDIFPDEPPDDIDGPIMMMGEEMREVHAAVMEFEARAHARRIQERLEEADEDYTYISSSDED